MRKPGFIAASLLSSATLYLFTPGCGTSSDTPSPVQEGDGEGTTNENDTVPTTTVSNGTAGGSTSYAVQAGVTQILQITGAANLQPYEVKFTGVPANAAPSGIALCSSAKPFKKCNPIAPFFDQANNTAIFTQGCPPGIACKTLGFPGGATVQVIFGQLPVKADAGTTNTGNQQQACATLTKDLSLMLCVAEALEGGDDVPTGKIQEDLIKGLAGSVKTWSKSGTVGAGVNSIAGLCGPTGGYTGNWDAITEVLSDNKFWTDVAADIASDVGQGVAADIACLVGTMTGVGAITGIACAAYTLAQAGLCMAQADYTYVGAQLADPSVCWIDENNQGHVCGPQAVCAANVKNAAKVPKWSYGGQCVSTANAGVDGQPCLTGSGAGACIQGSGQSTQCVDPGKVWPAQPGLGVSLCQNCGGVGQPGCWIKNAQECSDGTAKQKNVIPNQTQCVTPCTVCDVGGGARDECSLSTFGANCTAVRDGTCKPLYSGGSMLQSTVTLPDKDGTTYCLCQCG
jgi:hypothetical protein